MTRDRLIHHTITAVIVLFLITLLMTQCEGTNLYGE